LLPHGTRGNDEAYLFDFIDYGDSPNGIGAGLGERKAGEIAAA
jgi:hypothetical protein